MVSGKDSIIETLLLGGGIFIYSLAWAWLGSQLGAALERDKHKRKEKLDSV